MLSGPVTATFPPELTSAGAARAFVRAALDGDDSLLLDDVVLMVSELVTNAVVHASTEIEVHVRSFDGMIRVEVRDQDGRQPAQAPLDLMATGGRGMALVDLLADAWGVLPHTEGKTVWFERLRPVRPQP